MPTITQILDKVFPKLRAIEEQPEVTIIRIDGAISSNPFQGKKNDVYSISFTVPCIFSEQPEIVKTSSNITTEQQMYFYIKMSDLKAAETQHTPMNVTGVISLKDKFVFKQRRYAPVEVQEVFGLWKIKVNKE